MKTLFLLFFLGAQGAHVYAQDSIYGSWEDSLAHQRPLQRLGKDMCKCWEKEVDKLPKGPKFFFERFTGDFESYKMDLEDYYNHDTISMRLDGEIASQAIDQIQSCITNLQKKHSEVLDEYNYLELYYPLQLYFEYSDQTPSFLADFELGLFTTHPEQHQFVTIIQGLINDIRGNEYSKKVTGIHLLTVRMKSIICDAEGDSVLYKELLEDYKADSLGYYEGDMQIMEMYVLPILDEALQVAKVSFQEKFGVLDSTDINIYFEEYVSPTFRDKLLLEKSLILMRLSQEQ
ncbi:MAG: hypothetical protein NXI10_07890 [bacterium]|nr:hypothetical protein [bacterium]